MIADTVLQGLQPTPNNQDNQEFLASVVRFDFQRLVDAGIGIQWRHQLPDHLSLTLGEHKWFSVRIVNDKLQVHYASLRGYHNVTPDDAGKHIIATHLLAQIRLAQTATA